MKNIREIAKLSGFSTATVSRYVNKSGYVSEKAAKQIQEVLDNNVYHPNKLAKAIFKGRSDDVCLMVQNVINPFFAELIDEIETIAQNNDLNLIICNTKGNVDVERKYYNEMIEKRVAGIMVVNTCDPTIYSNHSIPVIGIENKIDGFPHITVDNAQGIDLLMSNIKKIEEKNILYITGSSASYSSRAREKQFKDNASKSDLKYTIIRLDDNFTSLNDFMIDPEKYDLIMCWNDMVAHKVCSLLEKDSTVEVTGFDGLNLNCLFSYQLTTVNQNIAQIGEKSLQMLMDLIANNPVEDVLLELTFQPGSTTVN